MNTQTIIEKFELQVDDSSELSIDEELALANKVYFKVCDDRPWEFLKKEFSGVTNGSARVSLPADFSYFIEFDDDMKKIIWVGSSTYRLVKFSDRRLYTNNSMTCYVDLSTNELVFMVSPTSGLTVTADYISTPPALSLTDSPIFPERYHPILYHLMAIEDFIIQQGNKNESYASENKSLADSYLRDMQYWNARLTNE